MRNTETIVMKTIRSLLQEQADMFKLTEGQLLAFVDRSKIKFGSRIWFQVPKVSRGEVGGLTLIENCGYLSISEIYEQVGNRKSNPELELISYTYKYIDARISYNWNCSRTNTADNSGFYYFHYDMDLSPPVRPSNGLIMHDNFHLQVLHNHPRFKMSEKITLSEFLLTVRKVCFYKENPLAPREEPIFSVK